MKINLNYKATMQSIMVCVEHQKKYTALSLDELVIVMHPRISSLFPEGFKLHGVDFVSDSWFSLDQFLVIAKKDYEDWKQCQ